MGERIMYVCSDCADNSPEGCGHFSRDNLRVMPDGRWLCDPCFEETTPADRGLDPEGDGLCWSDFPAPPEYVPQPAPAVGEVKQS